MNPQCLTNSYFNHFSFYSSGAANIPPIVLLSFGQISCTHTQTHADPSSNQSKLINALFPCGWSLGGNARG